jgi:flagellar hook-length control protein FliK
VNRTETSSPFNGTELPQRGPVDAPSSAGAAGHVLSGAASAAAFEESRHASQVAATGAAPGTVAGRSDSRTAEHAPGSQTDISDSPLPAPPPVAATELGGTPPPRSAEAAPALPADIGQGVSLRDAAEPVASRSAEPAASSSTTTAQQLPESDPRRNIADQLVANVRSTPSGAIEIRLSPEELGHVRVDMRMTEAGLTVVVDADRSDTLDLMRRSADFLARELRDAGFDAVTLAFGSGTSHRDGRQPAPLSYGDDDGAAALRPPETAAGQRPGEGRLDLRL